MREHKAAATTAGVLYITGTVATVLSKVVSAPVRDAGDPLAVAAEHSGAVVTSGLLVLVMGLSLAFIPVVLFPVLRRVDEVLAIGYLILRGAVETVCYVVLAVGWLMLAPLGEVMSAGPGTASPAGVRLGSLVIDSDATSAVAHARVLPWCRHVLRPAVSIAHRPPLDRAVGSPGDPVLRGRRRARGVCGHRRQLHGAELAVRPAGRAGDGAGGLDDRARLPSGGILDWTRTASSLQQPSSASLSAAGGPQDAWAQRARRVVMPQCGARGHHLLSYVFDAKRASPQVEPTRSLRTSTGSQPRR